MKLSAAQQEVVRQLRRAPRGSSLSAFGMGASLGTLRALERKGVVRRTEGLGSIFYPRTEIRWALVPGPVTL